MTPPDDAASDVARVAAIVKRITSGKRRTVHMAHALNGGGDVSALCYSTPRPIDMKRASWTLTPAFVTCKSCRAALQKKTEQHP